MLPSFFVSIVVYGRQRSAATDVVTAISLWPATYLSAIIVVIRERQTAAHLLDSGSGDRESRLLLGSDVNCYILLG